MAKKNQLSPTLSSSLASFPPFSSFFSSSPSFFSPSPPMPQNHLVPTPYKVSTTISAEILKGVLGKFTNMTTSPIPILCSVQRTESHCEMVLIDPCDRTCIYWQKSLDSKNKPKKIQTVLSMNPANLLHQLITLSRRGKFNYSPIRLATETPTLATNSTLCVGQVKVETLEKDFFPIQ